MAEWDKRKSSKYLWIVLVIGTAASCGIFVYFSFASDRKEVSFQRSKYISSNPEMLTAEECVSVCDSKECIRQSKHLLYYMDADADPCENFHQFACGKVSEKEDPERKSHVMQRFSDIIAVKLKTLLDNIEADPSSGSGKMKIVYDSCIKYSSSDLKAIPTVLEFLSGVGIRGWPNLDSDFRFVNPSLPRVIANILSYDEFGFIKFSTSYAYMYSYEYDLEVNTTLFVGKSPYENHKKPARKYLVDRTLNYFNLNIETSVRIWEESEAIHDAIISLRQESRKIKENTYSNNFLDCTQDTAKEWKELCETLEIFIDITYAKEKVSKDHAEIEDSLYLIQNIFPLLRNFSDRSIANYLALNLLFNNLDEFNFYFRLSSDRVTPDGYIEPSRLKWMKCINWISKNMEMALGYEYLKTELKVPLIQDVQSLIYECINETADLLSRQEWMTEEEKAKVKEETLEIGENLDTLIEYLTNETRINLFHEQFHPTEENYFKNVLEYKKSLRIFFMQALFPIEDRSYRNSIFLPNAAGGGGTIDIQLGLLIPPIYTPQLQRSMNLVSLGLMLTHEIGHLIHQIFYFYTNQPEYYEGKYKCQETLYSQFVFETIGKNMNASGRYRQENFADNIAISVIDKIIEKYASDNSSALMPSLSFSLKQQLYINTGHMWCSTHTKESDEWNYEYASHTADRFRILGMMQNSRGFSEAFGCKDGSYMNPVTKCLFLE